jgi:ribosomal protein S18 acetylase RimI-like enzyme
MPLFIPETIYTWRRLTPADAPVVEDLHRASRSDLLDPALVKPEAPGFFAELLAGRGFGFGCFHDEELIAFGTTINDVKPGDELWRSVGKPGDDRVAKLHGSAVRSGHRGRGLHKMLIAKRMRQLQQLGLDAIYSTAHPSNVGSLKNLLDAGFEAHGLASQYGGLLRMLLRWESSTTRPIESLLETAFTPLDDHDSLFHAFRDGWIGFDLTTDENERHWIAMHRRSG